MLDRCSTSSSSTCLRSAPSGCASSRHELRRYRAWCSPTSSGTDADYEVCVAAGCDLFQGYFFCRPAVVERPGVAANQPGAPAARRRRSHDPGIELGRSRKLIARRRGAQLPAAALRQLGLLRAAHAGRPVGRRWRCSASRTSALGDDERVRRDRQQTAELTLTRWSAPACASWPASHRRAARRAVHPRAVLGGRRHDGRADARRGSPRFRWPRTCARHWCRGTGRWASC